MTETAIPLLFVSRRDSLRSVLARACMQQVGRGRFAVHTCGVAGELAAQADPAALEALAQAHIPAPLHRPTSWDAFRRPSSPPMRLVIVLDKPAASLLHALPHQPDIAVWPYADLLAAGAPAPDAVKQVLLSLRHRLEILANLPMRHANADALRQDIRDLGRL